MMRAIVGVFLLMLAGCSTQPLDSPRDESSSNCYISLSTSDSDREGAASCVLTDGGFDRVLTAVLSDGTRLAVDFAPSAHPPLLSFTAVMSTPSWHCDHADAVGSWAVIYRDARRVLLTARLLCDDANAAHTAGVSINYAL